jgi:hypothetical protein
MRKLVAIMTCHQRRAWADAQRKTWVKDVVAHGYADVKFFYGAPRSAGSAYVMEPDEVWLGGDDSYRGIPLKVQGICRWATEHCYDWGAKVDDDVYIVPDRFPNLPFGVAHYIGRFRGPHGRVYPPHFASGFTYWLDNPAMQIIADTPWNGDWMDERFVATCLARHGIFGYNDPINYLVTGPHLDAATILSRPILKSGTVFCEYGPAAILELHKVMKDLQPVAGHTGLREVPRMAVTDAILRSAPDDRIAQHKLERYYRRNGVKPLPSGMGI